MILPDLLLLLLLTGGTRPSHGTPPDPESPARPHRTAPGIHLRTDSAGVLPGTESPSHPNSTETRPPPEPDRTDNTSLPDRTEIGGSEPNRTNTPSLPDRTHTEHPGGAELYRTETRSPPETDRTDTSFGSQLPEPHFPSEPNRTDSTSLPDRTEHPGGSELNRTDTLWSSDPNGTGTRSISAPSSTDPRAWWQSHKAGLLHVADVRPVSEFGLMGRKDFRWDVGGTEPEFSRTDGETSPAFGITQKSVTRRHISKRTPNMAATYVSTTGEQNLVLVTNNTDLSQNPTASTTDMETAPPNTRTQETGSVPEESGNQTLHSGGITHGFGTRAEDSGNTTRTFVTSAEDSGSTTHGSFTREKDSGNTTYGSVIRAEDSGDTTHGSVTRAEDSGNTTHGSVTRRKDFGNTTYGSVTRTTDSGITTHGSATRAEDFGNTTHGSVTRTEDSGSTTHGSVTRAEDSGDTSYDSGPTMKDPGNTTHGSVTRAEDSGNTTHGSVTRAEDSGNTTHSSITVMQDSEHSTETPVLNKSDPDLAASITYPLQTPSYLVTTYPSDQIPESSAPFTSVPVTAPNTTNQVPETDVPASDSTFVTSSSSSTNASLLDFSASSSASPFSLSEGAGTSFKQSSSDVSSSPISSTLGPFSTSPSETSPKFTSTEGQGQQTTLLTTLQTTPDLPSPSSSPSVPPSSPSAPPSSHTTPSSEPSTSYRTSSPTSRTEQTSEASGRPTPGLGDTSTTEAGPRFLDGTTSAVTDLRSTQRSDMDAPTSVTSPKEGGTQSIAMTTHVTEPPAQPTSPVSLTTSVNLLIPSPRFSTQWPHQGNPETTRPGGPAPTTGDPSKQVTTIRTTSVDTKIVVPKVETTTNSKERKVPTHTPKTQPGVVTAKYSTTASTRAPTPAVPPTPSPPTPVNVCLPNPCHNGGKCVPHGTHQKSYRCECPAAWQGKHCDSDVDECLSSPCAAPSTCANLRGSFTCHCPLGYIMEKGNACVQVRTFLGHIEIPRSFLNGSNGKFTKLQQIEEEIVHILNSSFSAIAGFYQSSITNSSFSNRIELYVQNLFLLSSNVTLYDLRRHIQRYKRGCQSAPQHSAACQLILHSELYYVAVSMCHMKNLGCDNETSECADPAGIAQCQCKAGYFKYSAMDRSCRACDDGYRLQEGVCVRCPFGLGGFNCSNPYQLITVIISAAGGGLLLILGIALAVTCCRKSRHDISKLIFKSGDFQMSPYAEYPKTPRSSEWGRETIEMQENGSTKNLLQMTDVYYSPGLRNSEMERNGLYPYSGLPGSRHSCIYPGQYNPTFINEENRRRDYF